MILSLILPVIILAVTVGNSYSKTTVKTDIEGEGSVYTRIETEVNGQKQVLESTQEGEQTVELKSEDSAKSDLASSSSEINEPDIKNESEDFQKEKNFLQKIIEFFTKLFDRFL